MSGASNKRGVVVQLTPARARRIQGNRIGLLVGDDERGPLVDYPGNAHGPLVARTTVPLDSAALAEAATCAREVLLTFASEHSDEPIIVGLLEPVRPREPRLEPAPDPVAHLEARVDGRVVVLEGKDEIVLRCGEASITLRRNGRVVIRGTYVETRSRGINRVKGGTVQIN